MIEQLTNEVYQKLNMEYQKYINKMLKKSPKEIIENAYPIVIKQELVDMFYSVRNYDEDGLKGLLIQENTLQFLYDAWLDIDGGIHNLLEECLMDTITEIGEDYNDILKDKLKSDPNAELIECMASALGDFDDADYELCSALKDKYNISELSIEDYEAGEDSIKEIDIYEIFCSKEGKKYLYNTFLNLKDNDHLQYLGKISVINSISYKNIEEKILPKLKELIILDNKNISKNNRIKEREEDEIR